MLAVILLSAALPFTSPALPDVWVGECTGSWPPTPAPRMLGRSCWRRTSHREGPASSPSPASIRLFSLVDGRCSSCPLRRVPTVDERHLPLSAYDKVWFSPGENLPFDPSRGSQDTLLFIRSAHEKGGTGCSHVAPVPAERNPGSLLRTQIFSPQ